MFFTTLSNFIVFLVLVGIIALPAFFLDFFYPFSHKICVKISDYIVRMCAPLIFSILKTYTQFRLTLFSDKKQELPEQFILISNHQSLLDIPVYMVFLKGRDVRFVAKDSLSHHIPLVSPMLKSHGHCFIPRIVGASVGMKRIDAFSRRCLENKWNPVIFPEGTRSRDGSVGKFYSAGFRRIADSTKLPIVACVVDEGYKINDIRHVVENMRNVNYHVKILKVYPPALTKEDQVAILEDSHNLMEKQLEEWRK